MKTQMHLVRSYMTFCLSLVQLLLVDKQSTQSDPHQQVFPLHWEYLFDRFGNIQAHSEFNRSYIFSDFGLEMRQYAEAEGQGALMMLFMD
mmetsp:Transcript_6418/g.10899  ORF Transcript_6418/g.10899 Transcript_6418/m.10899 type:complete len:90 (+) Transcript_6418:1339-1608(+)